MIRINGTEMKDMSARFSGTILTLTGRNAGVTLERLAQLLAGEPLIEALEDGSVRAVYRALQLRALTMETVAGMLITTAVMAAKPVEPAAGEDSAGLAAQIEEARAMAQAAMDAVKAMEEGIGECLM